MFSVYLVDQCTFTAKPHFRLIETAFLPPRSAYQLVDLSASKPFRSAFLIFLLSNQLPESAISVLQLDRFSALKSDLLFNFSAFPLSRFSVFPLLSFGFSSFQFFLLFLFSAFQFCFFSAFWLFSFSVSRLFSFSNPSLFCFSAFKLFRFSALVYASCYCRAQPNITNWELARLRGNGIGFGGT